MMITQNKPIEVITYTDKAGRMIPKKFKIIAEDESEVVINIKAVLTMDKVKIDNKVNIVYRCQAIINNRAKLFVLRFIMMETRWLLYQM